MQVDEIFKDIRDHMLQGVMMHSQLTDIACITNIDFLYCQQKLRHEEESDNLKEFEKYYINNYDKILQPMTSFKSIIPKEVLGSYENTVKMNHEMISTCAEYIMKTWVDWESESKTLYSMRYLNLFDMHEIAASQVVKDLIVDVDQELTIAKRLQQLLSSVNYDISSILTISENELKKIKELEKSFYMLKMIKINNQKDIEKIKIEKGEYNYD